MWSADCTFSLNLDRSWAVFRGDRGMSWTQVRIPDLALLMVSDETLQQPLLALQALPLKVARAAFGMPWVSEDVYKVIW